MIIVNSTSTCCRCQSRSQHHRFVMCMCYRQPHHSRRWLWTCQLMNCAGSNTVGGEAGSHQVPLSIGWVRGWCLGTLVSSVTTIITSMMIKKSCEKFCVQENDKWVSSWFISFWLKIFGIYRMLGQLISPTLYRSSDLCKCCIPGSLFYHPPPFTGLFIVSTSATRVYQHIYESFVYLNCVQIYQLAAKIRVIDDDEPIIHTLVN